MEFGWYDKPTQCAAFVDDQELPIASSSFSEALPPAEEMIIDRPTIYMQVTYNDSINHTEMPPVSGPSKKRKFEPFVDVPKAPYDTGRALKYFARSYPKGAPKQTAQQPDIATISSSVTPTVAEEDQHLLPVDKTSMATARRLPNVRTNGRISRPNGRVPSPASTSGSHSLPKAKTGQSVSSGATKLAGLRFKRLPPEDITAPTSDNLGSISEMTTDSSIPPHLSPPPAPQGPGLSETGLANPINDPGNGVHLLANMVVHSMGKILSEATQQSIQAALPMEQQPVPPPWRNTYRPTFSPQHQSASGPYNIRQDNRYSNVRGDDRSSTVPSSFPTCKDAQGPPVEAYAAQAQFYDQVYHRASHPHGNRPNRREPHDFKAYYPSNTYPQPKTFKSPPSYIDEKADVKRRKLERLSWNREMESSLIESFPPFGHERCAPAEFDHMDHCWPPVVEERDITRTVLTQDLPEMVPVKLRRVSGEKEKQKNNERKREKEKETRRKLNQAEEAKEREGEERGKEGMDLDPEMTTSHPNVNLPPAEAGSPTTMLVDASAHEPMPEVSNERHHIPTDSLAVIHNDEEIGDNWEDSYEKPDEPVPSPPPKFRPEGVHRPRDDDEVSLGDDLSHLATNPWRS
ncbi:hypothetical protein BDZ97DRAFT_163985 [Flammula alnicola]|nr:hypothetical protein BDZ97DRAFT_163985 [Flammula alnicola]